MSELQTLQAIVADENRSGEERKAAAEHILALGQKPAPVQQLPAMSDDFRWFCVWYTWRYGPNGGAGEFDKWAATEGAKLTTEHDQRLLKEIETLKADEQDDLTRIAIRFCESQLSWNYRVAPQYKQHASSFRKLVA